MLLGTALWCRGEIQARRRETDRAAELAAALGEMAAEIRSLRRPMPRLLERQARRALCGGCFARVLWGLERGQPLQDAWEDGFRELTPPDSMLDFFRSDTPLTAVFLHRCLTGKHQSWHLPHQHQIHCNWKPVYWLRHKEFWFHRTESLFHCIRK